MATTIEHFATSSPPVPKEVYLDTSFILRCYFARFTPRGLPTREINKNSECNRFLARLLASTMHTSLLSVEESFHKLYFTNHIRRAAKTQNLENNWKKFKADHPAAFAAARATGLQEIRRFAAFLGTVPIHYVEATSFFQRQKYLTVVKTYAKLLLEKYDVIEAMDSFHLAVMRANRIDWFVTAEERFGTAFGEFSVLTL